MDNTDAAAPQDEQKRIALLYAQAAIITDAELLDLIHRHSLDELALIVIAFYDEATAFLLDPQTAWEHMMALVAVIVRHLSEDDHVVFDAYFRAAIKGYTEGSEEILDQLPEFDYASQGDRMAFRITFPDAEAT